MQSVKGIEMVREAGIAGSDFMPDKDTVVSSEVLAQVFEDKQLPFQTNPDGSVDMSVYLDWLNEAGRVALQAFEDCFDHDDGFIELPAARRA